MEIIDTLAYAKKLIQSGVPESQAEIQAETLSKALSEIKGTDLFISLLPPASAAFLSFASSRFCQIASLRSQ